MFKNLMDSVSLRKNMVTSFLCLVLVAAAEGYIFVDLSHPQQNDTIYWPGVPSFTRSIVSKSTNDYGVWIEVGAYSSGEHGGTHIDSPRHFFNASWDLKDLPLERTVAEGVMIDCKKEAAANRDYTVTVEKLKKWEEENGRIPNQAAVLINFGWTPKWQEPTDFLGTNDITNPSTFHFPFMDAQAAQWLIDNRDVKIVGLDVPAPDGPRDKTFPVHIALLSRNIIILENVMIPNSLPSRNFRLHAAPIRIEGGTGTQTRIYAMLHDFQGDGASANFAFFSITAFILALIVMFNNTIH